MDKIDSFLEHSLKLQRINLNDEDWDEIEKKLNTKINNFS